MEQVSVSYGLGLDMSMEKFDACLKVSLSCGRIKIVARRKFANTAKGFAALDKWLRSKLKGNQGHLRIVMEVTGVYHESLLYFLHEEGYHVSVVLGRQSKAYFKSLGLDSKNDPSDAQGLAQMAIERKLPAWKPLSEKMLQIRQLLRHRAAMIEQRTMCKNQLHAKKHEHRPSKEVIKSLKKRIIQLDKVIQDMERKAKEIFKTDQDLNRRAKRIVDSLKGMGWLTMMILLAETDGFVLFLSRKQLASYAGYDIIENQSGKFSGKTRISKRGNARIRKAMYMPSMAHLRAKEGPLYQLYLRLLKKNGGIKKKAQVAVQRKLLCLVFTLWKKEQEYDPEFYLKNEGSSDLKSELHEIQERIPVP